MRFNRWFARRQFDIYYWLAMRLPKWLVRMALYRAGWTLINDDEVVPEVTFMDLVKRS